MCHKIGLTIEVFTPEERNAIMDKLTELLNTHSTTTRKFTVAYEEATVRGKKTVKETLEFTPGESIDISEFGMLVERPMEAALRSLSETVSTDPSYGLDWAETRHAR